MLPTPQDLALQHSTTLSALIKQDIQQQGGLISFADYMQHALYAPGLGYYAAGAAKFGPAGDFVTAPEISSLFGATLAGQINEILNQINHNTIMELGAGTGRLAFDILTALSTESRLPTQYYILEPNADLRARQQDLLATQFPCVQWLDNLPTEFNGVIIANEVFDALPVYLFEYTPQGFLERCVGLDANHQFCWQTRPFKHTDLLQEIATLTFAPGYCSELHPHAAGLIASLAKCLNIGACIIIDYGFEAEEYYHPARSQGTLRCHYRHNVIDDPFFYPGLQDITADVNFSALLDSALANHLEPLGFTTQASFLLHAGIIARAEQLFAQQQDYKIQQALQLLIDPHEMGSLFKVAGFSKGADLELSGFGLHWR